MPSGFGALPHDRARAVLAAYEKAGYGEQDRQEAAKSRTLSSRQFSQPALPGTGPAPSDAPDPVAPKVKRGASYPEHRAAAWTPKKDAYGSTIGPRSFEEWKATENVPGEGQQATISMAPGAAIAAAHSGRVKSLFELPEDLRNKKSESYHEYRKGTEKSLLGLAPTAAASRRPVYGHLHDEGDFGEGAMYGRIHLDLWPGKNHITTTANDSLDTLVEEHGGFNTSAGHVPMADAWRSTQFADLNKSHNDGDANAGDYREVQIHGKVPMSNIRRVQVHEGDPVADQKVLDAFRAKGVSATRVGRITQPSLFDPIDNPGKMSREEVHIGPIPDATPPAASVRKQPYTLGKFS